MFTKPEKNYFINVVLTIISLVCIITGFMITSGPFSGGSLNLGRYLEMRTLHTWTGYIMTAIIVIHLLMHVKWIKSVTKNLFNRKKKILALVITIVVSVGICYAITKMAPQSLFPVSFPGAGGFDGSGSAMGSPFN